MVRDKVLRYVEEDTAVSGPGALEIRLLTDLQRRSFVTRLDEGAVYLLDAHERMTVLGDRGGATSTAAMAAMALGLAGRRLEAERVVQRALTLSEEIGAPSATAFVWMILAECLEQYGAYTRAEDAAQRGLKIAREIEHREWTLSTLGPIGRVRRARGDRARPAAPAARTRRAARTPAARNRAAAFLRNHPGSVLTSRVRQYLGD